MWDEAGDLVEYAEAARAAAVHGIAVDPPLLGLLGADAAEDALALLEESRARLLSRYWSGLPAAPLRFRTILPTDGYARRAVHEALFGTALRLSFEQQGNLELTAEAARGSAAALGEYIAQYGIGALLRLYHLVTSRADLMALRHYGELTAEELWSGRLHRPWTEHSLAEERNLALGLRYIAEDRSRRTRATGRGRSWLDAAEQLMEQSGMRSERRRNILATWLGGRGEESRRLHRLLPYDEAAQRLVAHLREIDPRRGTDILDAGLDGSRAATRLQQAEEGRLTVATVSRPHSQEVAVDGAQVPRRAMRMQGPLVPEARYDRVIGIAAAAGEFGPPAQLLRGARRALRPGGVLAVAVVRVRSLLEPFELGPDPTGTAGQSLFDRAAAAGFELLRTAREERRLRLPAGGLWQLGLESNALPYLAERLPHAAAAALRRRETVLCHQAERRWGPEIEVDAVIEWLIGRA